MLFTAVIRPLAASAILETYGISRRTQPGSRLPSRNWRFDGRAMAQAVLVMLPSTPVGQPLRNALQVGASRRLAPPVLSRARVGSNRSSPRNVTRDADRIRNIFSYPFSQTLGSVQLIALKSNTLRHSPLIFRRSSISRHVAFLAKYLLPLVGQL